ncbi:MAG: hypothetical protein ACJ768_08800 [Gaiellaceae bacterium]
MRIAVVLGAGATLAQAQYARALGRSGELPPLDTSFFDVLRHLGVEIPPSLREYAAELLGADPFVEGGPSPRMEEFFKDAFYDFIRAKKQGGRSAELLGELLVAYREALLPTTERVWKSKDRGPLADLLAASASAAKYVDIITFNHDVLVENVLADLAAAQGRWCLRHGYGHFAAKRRFTQQKDAIMFKDPKTCQHPDPIRLFKLHGSLNWYVDTDSPMPESAVLRGERGTNQRILITRRRRVPRSLRHSGHFSWPVLIPPIYVKQPFIQNFMAPVWQDARNSIASCDRLVFYGYSMPVLDIEAEKEFQRATAKNSNLGYVDVVNPSTTAASRYAEALPRLSVRWHGSLETFLAEAPFD